jgi:O-antigen ligase
MQLVAPSLRLAGPEYRYSVQQEQPRCNAELRVLLFVCWVLSLACLNPPGRGLNLDVNVLDPTALAKVVVRSGSLLTLTLLVLRLQARTKGAQVLSRLFPLALAALWAMASTIWSPLKAVSFGHGSELLMMVMLAVAAGYICKEEASLKIVFFHLFCIILLLAISLLCVNTKALLGGGRMTQYMQPNTAANIASVGLLILVTCRLLWNWQWTRVLLWPGLLILGLVEFVAHSRSAIISISLVLILICLRLRTSILFIFACGAVGLWAAGAPYIASMSKLPASTAHYMMRGQTTQEAMSLSGRTELWNIGIRSFWESPIYGHGYYVMTDTGFMQVWRKKMWQTAHNSYLHILTGVGLIGSVLFLAAFLWVLVPLRRVLLLPIGARRVAFLVFLFVTYYIVLGCFELSFVGAVDPATVTFFMILGISAGQVASLKQSSDRRCYVVPSLPIAF